MSQLPFSPLPPFAPRRFVPTPLDLGDWSQLEPLFDQLERQVQAAQSIAALEQWILDGGELTAVLDEEGSKRYIAMSCHTDDPAAEQAYLHFVEQIEPEVKRRQFRLAERLLQHPLCSSLPRERYEVYVRNHRLLVELFRPENVALETEETTLGQLYQKRSGALTVTFAGEEQTLPRMARYAEEPDRTIRQSAWEAVTRRRLEESAAFEELFAQLQMLRQRMARQAGFVSYRDYAFRSLRRFDYTVDDCLRFHEAIESEVVPLVRELQAKRCTQLQLNRLRPWDQAVDPRHRPPLRPFQTVDELLRGVRTIVRRLDPTLSEAFALLEAHGLLDLSNRKGKAPGGYQATLNEARLPFIFMNAVGVQRDVETLLHEAGHAFHAVLNRSEPICAYRTPPIEFCEVASMTMELLGNEHLEEFYPREQAARARREHLEGILRTFTWVATIDAFQHAVYSQPSSVEEDRDRAWQTVMDRFEGDIDWTGWEHARLKLWHRQLHLFLHPFYYVEYGIAQLGALQLWEASRHDLPGTLQRYREALALGGARPLPELFAAAGCRFDFSAGAIRPLLQRVRQVLSEWGDADAG